MNEYVSRRIEVTGLPSDKDTKQVIFLFVLFIVGMFSMFFLSRPTGPDNLDQEIRFEGEQQMRLIETDQTRFYEYLLRLDTHQ